MHSRQATLDKEIASRQAALDKEVAKCASRHAALHKENAKCACRQAALYNVYVHNAAMIREIAHRILACSRRETMGAKLSATLAEQEAAVEKRETH